MSRAYLQIRTWVGSSAIGATHYYGELRLAGSKDDIQVERELNAREAKQINKDERARGESGFYYKAGMTSGRFWDEESVKQTAIEYVTKNHPEVAFLFEGSSAICDPQLVLVGPEPLKTQLNALVAEAEANDWWEGDDDTMENIYRRWKDLTQDAWK